MLKQRKEPKYWCSHDLHYEARVCRLMQKQKGEDRAHELAEAGVCVCTIMHIYIYIYIHIYTYILVYSS